MMHSVRPSGIKYFKIGVHNPYRVDVFLFEIKRCLTDGLFDQNFQVLAYEAAAAMATTES